MNDKSYPVDADGKVLLSPDAVQLLDREQAQVIADAIFEQFHIRGKLKTTTPHEHQWEEVGEGGMFSCTLCDEDGDLCMVCEEISSYEKCCNTTKGNTAPDTEETPEGSDHA